MPIYLGNDKLGNRIATLSREVGLTCPSSCPFLQDHTCYAERFQRRRPNVLKVHRRNNRADYESWKAELSLLDREYSLVAVRLLVAGDFLYRGRLDRDFLSAVLRLSRAFPEIPFFGYTHAWKRLTKYLPRFRAARIHLFASVTTKSHYTRASRLGWRVAYVDKALSKGDYKQGERVSISRILTCPEQTGTVPSCQECKYCFSDKSDRIVQNVHLLAH